MYLQDDDVIFSKCKMEKYVLQHTAASQLTQITHKVVHKYDLSRVFGWIDDKAYVSEGSVMQKMLPWLFSLKSSTSGEDKLMKADKVLYHNHYFQLAE